VGWETDGPDETTGESMVLDGLDLFFLDYYYEFL
jgi:hypothetical protein